MPLPRYALPTDRHDAGPCQCGHRERVGVHTATDCDTSGSTLAETPEAILAARETRDRIDLATRWSTAIRRLDRGGGVSIDVPIDLAARLTTLLGGRAPCLPGFELDALCSLCEPLAIALREAVLAAEAATLTDGARALTKGCWFGLWSLANACSMDPLQTGPVPLFAELSRVRDLVVRECLLAALDRADTDLAALVTVCGDGGERNHVAAMLAALVAEGLVRERAGGHWQLYSRASSPDAKTAVTLPAPPPDTRMVYLLSHHPSRSKEELLWWGPKSSGYTIGLDRAGKYTLAIRVVPSEHRAALAKLGGAS